MNKNTRKKNTGKMESINQLSTLFLNNKTINEKRKNRIPQSERNGSVTIIITETKFFNS